MDLSLPKSYKNKNLIRDAANEDGYRFQIKIQYNGQNTETSKYKEALGRMPLQASSPLKIRISCQKSSLVLYRVQTSIQLFDDYNTCNTNESENYEEQITLHINDNWDGLRDIKNSGKLSRMMKDLIFI